MPTPPPEETVREDVKRCVASTAQIRPGRVTFEMVLTALPLKLDDNKLIYLAMKLRGYTKTYNPQATIRLEDTRKDQQTVGGIAQVVYSRIVSKRGKRVIAKRGKRKLAKASTRQIAKSRKGITRKRGK